VAVAGAAAEPGVSTKQAEARQIMAQIDSLDAQVGAAVERWNLANLKLDRINKDLSRSRFELGVARQNLNHAQTDLARQAIEIYTSGTSTSTLDVLFGATSLTDLLDRLDSSVEVTTIAQVSLNLIGVAQDKLFGEAIP